MAKLMCDGAKHTLLILGMCKNVRPKVKYRHFLFNNVVSSKEPIQLIQKNFSLSGCSLIERNTDSQSSERFLPTLIYLQNPFTWLMNKLDFQMLRRAWDPDFDEKEFRRGTKQAASMICSLISKNLWDDLRGLVTRQALSRLQKDVETSWTDEQRRHVVIEVSDVKLALPRRLYFQKILDQRFVDVDMVFVAVKFKELDPSTVNDVIFIEMIARFHRNYTLGQLPNWTVSLFKVTRFHIVPR